MTFSIIAHCPRTGRFGVGSTTFSIACGRRNESIRANVGVCKSQAFYLRHVDVLALNMLEAGHTPQHILASLAASDPDFEYRQLGIVDREGRVAAHSGALVRPWSGKIVGESYAAYGNVLAGPQTVEGIVAGFLEHPDAPLEECLLEALEGGRDAGGQAADGVPWPERSAWICVTGQLDHPEVDLRVDLHERAVDELRRVFERFSRLERRTA
ncbi:MAG: DUF1028 domain-containing protein [Alphaproteobacteria bacterium]|nr:DUF1028 domain-containing protein [Alphaproteobacteria bacterium]